MGEGARWLEPSCLGPLILALSPRGEWELWGCGVCREFAPSAVTSIRGGEKQPGSDRAERQGYGERQRAPRRSPWEKSCDASTHENRVAAAGPRGETPWTRKPYAASFPKGETHSRSTPGGSARPI